MLNGRFEILMFQALESGSNVKSIAILKQPQITKPPL